MKSIAGLSPLFITFFALNASAATYTVDRTDDSAAAGAQVCSDATANDCSLRGAFIKADGDATNDTIVIPAGTYTLSIAQGGEGDNAAANTTTAGDLDVNNSLTVVGAGADATTIDASGIADDDRAIQVHAGVSAFSISGVTITGGSSGFRGGGLWAFTVTTVTISDCAFTSNHADSDGGALASDGSTTVNISNTTFSSNTASVRGGAIFHETGSEIITNSTFSGNSTPAASTGGGAIDIPTGSLTIISSTLYGNTVNDAAGDGGGIRNTTTGTVTIRNSILAENKVTTTDENCGGTRAFTSGGYNISDDASCAFAGTGDQNSVTGTIVSATLADNGGTTATHTISTGSPAIDIVPVASCTDNSGAALTDDQRGFTRPYTATGATDFCDVGAVEIGCGNSTVEASESCDDGAESATCDADCTSVSCGDGTLNTTAGEACDDGNNTDGDGCSSTCTTETDSGTDGTGGDSGTDTGGTGSSTTSGSGCALVETSTSNSGNITGLILTGLGLLFLTRSRASKT